MHKWLQNILCLRQYRIHTDLPPEVVKSRVLSLQDVCEFYFVRMREDRFLVAEKCLKYHGWGIRSRNSFAPRTWGKITEGEDGTAVSCIICMNGFTQIFSWVWLLPVFLVTLLMPLAGLLLLFFYTLTYFAFAKPAKRMMEALERALTTPNEE